MSSASFLYAAELDYDNHPGGERNTELSVSITEKINAWIKEFGSERDALNVAITRLESAQSLIDELQRELDDVRREWFEKSCM